MDRWIKTFLKKESRTRFSFRTLKRLSILFDNMLPRQRNANCTIWIYLYLKQHLTPFYPLISFSIYWGRILFASTISTISTEKMKKTKFSSTIRPYQPSSLAGWSGRRGKHYIMRAFVSYFLFFLFCQFCQMWHFIQPKRELLVE